MKFNVGFYDFSSDAGMNYQLNRLYSTGVMNQKELYETGRKAVDFDSLDQEPCRIFIMTLSPVNKTGPHLQFLAEVSLLFKSAEKRAQILNTADKAEVIRILT